MEIAVYGAGCRKCHTLLENTQKAVVETGVAAQVDYVTDMAQVAAKGIMSTPALTIDGVIVSTGRVLDTDAVVRLIEGRIASLQGGEGDDCGCSCGCGCC